MKGDFMWAVAQMRNGKKVRRGSESFIKKYLYCKMCLDEEILFFNGEETAIISIQDINATDWEIVEDKIIPLSEKQFYKGGTSGWKEVYYHFDVKEAVNNAKKELFELGNATRINTILKKYFGKEMVK